MTEQQLPENRSSAEKIMDLSAEVYSLRNDLLYERVGEAGMQTLADHNEQQQLFEGVAADMTPEGVALGALFAEQEYNELSHVMFNGRDYNTLDDVEKQRVENRAQVLREHQAAIRAEDPSGLARAVAERDQVDDELNRVFNTQSLGFKYRGALQKPDRFVVYNDNPVGLIHISKDLAIMPQIVVEPEGATAEAKLVPLIIDKETRRPLDLIRAGEAEDFISEEEKTETEEWLKGYPVDEPELIEALADNLAKVKQYLEDHLDPDTESRRMGIYGPEEPGDEQ